MNKYNLSMRINHWVLGLIIIGMLSIGFYMTSLNNSDLDKFNYYNLHKSFGVIALVIIIFRVLNRLLSRSPKDPKEFSFFEKILAKLGHFALYLLMVIMALSGYLMSMTGGHGIKLFGYSLPHFPPTDKALAKFFHEIHVLFPWVFVALIVIHFLAWPYHYLKDKVNIIKRMV